MVWCGMVWYGMLHGMVWNGVVKYGVWYGAAVARRPDSLRAMLRQSIACQDQGVICCLFGHSVIPIQQVKSLARRSREELNAKLCCLLLFVVDCIIIRFRGPCTCCLWIRESSSIPLSPKRHTFRPPSLCLNSFQTTLTPNPEQLYRSYSVAKQ